MRCCMLFVAVCLCGALASDATQPERALRFQARTVAEARAWQQMARAKLFALMMGGHQPARGPLDVKTLCRLEETAGGTVLEELSLQSLPDRRVHAWLARPAKSKVKLGGVLALHGHGGSGEQIVRGQGIYWYGRELIERGCVVIATDITAPPARPREAACRNGRVQAAPQSAERAPRGRRPWRAVARFQRSGLRRRIGRSRHTPRRECQGSGAASIPSARRLARPIVPPRRRCGSSAQGRWRGATPGCSRIPPSAARARGQCGNAGLLPASALAPSGRARSGCGCGPRAEVRTASGNSSTPLRSCPTFPGGRPARYKPAARAFATARCPTPSTPGLKPPWPRPGRGRSRSGPMENGDAR